MKKAFCFNFCACHVLRTNLSTSDLRFVQVTSVEKREPRGTFLSLGLRPRLQKTFPRFPFFYFGNLDKPQIRRGQICPQTWQAQKSKQNTINFFALSFYIFISFLEITFHVTTNLINDSSLGLGSVALDLGVLTVYCTIT